MRAESRPHPTHLWTDHRVQSLPLSQKRVLDYCWTGPDVNGIGATCVEALVWQARVGEIGVAIVSCLEILERLEFVYFDKQTMEIFVLDWFRFHKFATKPAMAAYAKGMRETRSAAIKKMAAERLKLSHPKQESVDNSGGIEEKQVLSTPTPTSTSTSTSTNTTTTSTKSGGGVFKSENQELQKQIASAVVATDAVAVAGSFLEGLGKASGLDCLQAGGNRYDDLCKRLAGAAADDARLAGVEAAAAINKGRANDPVAYALSMAKRAAEAKISKSKAAADAEKQKEIDALTLFQQSVAGKRFTDSDGKVYVVNEQIPHLMTIVGDGHVPVSAKFMKCVKRGEVVEVMNC